MKSARLSVFVTNCVLNASRVKVLPQRLMLISRMASTTVDACCSKGSPSQGNYNAQGTVKQVDGVKVYEVGNSSKTLLVGYDIFGFEIGNTRRFCDELAAAGFRVIMPDYFEGKPFSPDNFPPPNKQVILDFVDERGNWKIVREATETVLKGYKVTKFGMLGFCWGAKQVVRYATDPRCRVGVSVHGSFFEPSDGDHIQAPILFVVAGDDQPIEPLKRVIDSKKVGKQCIYKYYPTMSHGWCAARGDWNKPDVGAAAFEVIQLSKNFLSKYL